jgi:hypothetical protein
LNYFCSIFDRNQALPPSLEGKKISLSGIIFLWWKTNIPADEASVFSFPVNGQSIKTVLLLHDRHFHQQHTKYLPNHFSSTEIENYLTIGVGIYINCFIRSS